MLGAIPLFGQYPSAFFLLGALLVSASVAMYGASAEQSAQVHARSDNISSNGCFSLGCSDVADTLTFKHLVNTPSPHHPTKHPPKGMHFSFHRRALISAVSVACETRDVLDDMQDCHHSRSCLGPKCAQQRPALCRRLHTCGHTTACGTARTRVP